jgi:hypothetical protein
MNTATEHATRTGFGLRHPRSVILIRVLVTAWLLGLTGWLLATATGAGRCDDRGRGGEHWAGQRHVRMSGWRPGRKFRGVRGSG